MKLCIYGDGQGNYYQGRSPTGRVKYVSDYTAATFFSETDRDDAEDCLDLGLCLYAVEVSEPVLVRRGSGVSSTPGIKEQSFDNWQVHPMDLFGGR